MNIFYLDSDPKKCAECYYNNHVNKILLECTQMLSTATWCLNPLEAESLYKDGLCYAPTHINHPCNKWTRESSSNFLWTKNLVVALNTEKRHRFNSGNHKSLEVALSLPIPDNIKTKFTKPYMAMPNDLCSEDPIKSYRAYYMIEKRHLAKWTNRKPPLWWK